MALSSEESAKLLAAIDKLNGSTSVIEEVLQLIRNAQHTGAVDIAEHNNNELAHRNLKNLTVAGSLAADSLRTGTPFAGFNAAEYPFAVNSSGALGYTTAALRGTLSYPRFTLARTGVTESGEKTALPVGAPIGIYDFNMFDAASGDMLSGGSVYLSTVSGDATKTSLRLAARPGADGAVQSVLDVETNAVSPSVTSYTDLGKAGARFKDLHLANAPTVGSDARIKTDVASLPPEDALDFVSRLRPVTYRLKESATEVLSTDEEGNVTETRAIPGSRTHCGLIAQEVKEALGGKNMALWCLADKDDPNSRQSLRYEELIAYLIGAVQALGAKVEELERKVA